MLTKEQQSLLQLVFDQFMESGHWPITRSIQIALDLNGDFWEFARTLSWRILSVGEKYDAKAISKLSIRGITLCKDSGNLLDDFVRIVLYCVVRYRDGSHSGNDIVLTFEEIIQELRIDESRARLLTELMVSEVRIFGGHSTMTDGRHTDFRLWPDIYRFRKIVSATDYIAVMNLLEPDPLSIEPDIRPLIPDSIATNQVQYSPELDDIVAQFVSDQRLQEVLMQDLGEIRKGLHNELWKTVCILSGSVCEGLLQALFVADDANRDQTRKKKGTKIPRFQELIEMAITKQYLSERSQHLWKFIKSSRNVIHPNRAMEWGRVERDVGQACYFLLVMIAKDLRQHVNSGSIVGRY